jgi:hypothetical protein
MDAHPNPARTSHSRRLRWPVAAAATTCALVLVACGSTAKRPGSASRSFNADVKVAQCMRSRGVSNFPDPTAAVAGQGGGGFSIQMSPGSSAVTVNGISLSGPAYTTAAKTCHLSGAIDPMGLTATIEQQMIAKAHCIRTHGFPSFPDPTFGPNGHGVKFRPPVGFDLESPAGLEAAKACASVGTNIPGV